MGRIAYVNGRYLPQGQATVSIEDRGYQLGDGVYEVCEVRAGVLIDEARHLARLERSLSELRIAQPLVPGALSLVLREVLTRNKVRDGYVYVQVTRGVAPRDHAFPVPAVRPSLVVTAKAIDPAKGTALAAKGIKVISLPDIRWKRPDIKTINLLPNVLARQAAKEEGAYEAWLIDADGMVTEGAASNAWIVTADKTIVTHQVDQSILRGVTRTTLLDLIAAKGLRLEERRFSLEEAKRATEAFITGATTLVMPVAAIDDVVIGDGKPGALATSLRAQFHNFAKATP
ncbi:D-amino acid aminotransferase [Methylovirgula ligni]|uniref:Probable branched-chain-amino-acid aminotransferase n=1 Tax=Methylovirgula ligni TaxID=569860 RepID=A0A3D9YKX3_9HYPH|nr:D-amino-acid transaminase [Methylovirgula ligni]QAY96748.1 D-amino acid aminotransferase [Methylovirgula ligni]REF83205.1 D-alanine aminotransferase [Methylovirgula ligni]